MSKLEQVINGEYKELILKEINNPLNFGVKISRLSGDQIGTTKLVIEIDQFEEDLEEPKTRFNKVQGKPIFVVSDMDEITLFDGTKVKFAPEASSAVQPPSADADRPTPDYSDALAKHYISKDDVLKARPAKIKEYPIKIVDRDNHNNVWASSITHGLNDADSSWNQAIESWSKALGLEE